MAKKALILTVALLCAFAVPAMAQKKAGGDKKPVPAATAPAHLEVSDFGVRWQGMSEKEKEGFLRGMATAFRLVCMTAAAETTKNQDVAEFNKTFMECVVNFMPYQISMIKDAMTGLYQDSANNHIPYDMLYGVALLKAGGKPFDENLAQQRKISASFGKGAK